MNNEAMLIAEAHVATGRPSRYLVQICRHFDHKAQAHPEEQAHIEWADNHGVANFGWGRCTLRADAGVLTLRAEAPDKKKLQQVEQLIAVHLERFGRRDRLTVTWTPPQRSSELPPAQSPVAKDNAQADPPRYPGTGDGTDPGAPPGMPRWGKAKTPVVIVAMLALLFVVVRFFSGGSGGYRSGRHR